MYNNEEEEREERERERVGGEEGWLLCLSSGDQMCMSSYFFYWIFKVPHMHIVQFLPLSLSLHLLLVLLFSQFILSWLQHWPDWQLAIGHEKTSWVDAVTGILQWYWPGEWEVHTGAVESFFHPLHRRRFLFILSRVFLVFLFRFFSFTRFYFACFTIFKAFRLPVNTFSLPVTSCASLKSHWYVSSLSLIAV